MYISYICISHIAKIHLQSKFSAAGLLEQNVNTRAVCVRSVKFSSIRLCNIEECLHVPCLIDKVCCQASHFCH